MKKINSTDEKKILLDMLLYFDELCRKHHLNYTLDSGTLLGAARHQGFIPWDDDIDVALPLPDYLKFITLKEFRECDNQYVLHEARYEKKNNENYHYPYAKLEDRTTYVKYEEKYDKGGVFIDVFPLTAYPNDTNECYSLVDEMEKLRWKIFVGLTKYNNPLKKVIALLISKEYRSYRNKMMTDAFAVPYDNAKYVGNIFWASKNNYKKIPKVYLDHYIKLPFEDREFNVISNYKSLLRILYGNWEVLPPKSQRMSHSMSIYKK